MQASNIKISFFLIYLLQLLGKPTFLLFKLFAILWLYFFTSISKLSHLKIKLKFKKRAKKQRFLRSFQKYIKRIFKKHKRVVTRSRFTPNKNNVFKFLINMTITFFVFTPLYGLTYTFLSTLPSVKLLKESPPSLTTKIFDRHGELLYQIYKDENRTLVALEDIPAHMINATLAAEDKNFYHHIGVDPGGILRAFTNNIKCRLKSKDCTTLQGGSTITQQLIKNTLLTSERTFSRKLKELILSLQTEHTYSKDEILEMYLNQVGYGGTAYGIEQASQQYFGTSVQSLTLAQSAMLAGLPISPTTLSPFGTNPYLGKIRQQQVLESMVKRQMITENDKIEALSQPLAFNPQTAEIKAPHFVMYVKDLLVQRYGEELVSRGGLEVTTSLDLNYQTILQKQINQELERLSRLNVKNGAGLVISPQTGEILAMVGSKDFFDTKNDGQVNIVTQKRQPGSSIKPITYALALSHGANPSTVIDDSPICFIISGQPDYCPKNYDGKFHGQVSLRTALASSYNIPAIKLLNSYGISNMISLAKQMGITTWDDSSRFGLSLTLGGGEITMLDLASVYSVFANDGKKITFNPIISIKNTNQDTYYYSKQEEPIEVISPAIAYQISSILSDKNARSPAFGYNSILNLPGENVAVKTGTTNNLRDNWTFGYTKDLLVATWVGNNDNSPMSSVASGITGASPIWAQTMKQLLENYPATAFIPPSNMVKANLSCANPPRYEYVVEGQAPIINCAQKTGSITDFGATTSQ